ncbi:MAG: hypothetical protein AAFV93_22065 [Chloroflexota bacterium]
MKEFQDFADAIETAWEETVKSVVLPIVEKLTIILQDFIGATWLTDSSWERYPDESLIEWGKRLEANGWLDNPEIRWAYQKAALRHRIESLWSVSHDR